MTRLLLIPTMMVFVGLATAEEPGDPGTKRAITIGPFELSARTVTVKSRSSQLDADGMPSMNCSLRGDATIKIADFFVASADEITVAKGKDKFLQLHLRGNCTLTCEWEEQGEISAVADQVRLGDGKQFSLLSKDPGRVRLTYREDEKSTVIEASSI